MTTTPPERFGPPVCDNYDVAEFNGVVLSLFELFRANLIKTQKPLIQNRTFTNCIIEGPAVLLAMSGVHFNSCNLGMATEDPRSLLLMPMAKNKVVGAIAFKDCSFQNCQFFAIGFTGGDAFLDRMLQVLDPNKSTGSDA